MEITIFSGYQKQPTKRYVGARSIKQHPRPNQSCRQKEQKKSNSTMNQAARPFPEVDVEKNWLHYPPETLQQA